MIRIVKKLFDFLNKIIVIVTLLQLNLFAQNDWHYLKGPYGGNISSFFKDSSENIWITSPDQGMYRFDLQSSVLEYKNRNIRPNDMCTDTYGNLYVATFNGIYKSNDTGNNWVESNNGIPNDSRYRRINKLLATKDNIIFATTDEMGLFRSTDFGATWILINNGLEWQSINSICIDSTGNIYLATWEEFYYGQMNDYFKYGIFKSTDKGESWILAKETSTWINVLVVDNNSQLYAGLWRGGVIKSSDYGLNWENIGLDNSTIFSLEIDRDNQLYAGAFNGSPYNGDSLGIVYKLNYNLIWQKLFPISEYYYINSPISVLKLISNEILLIGTSGYNWGGYGDGAYLLNMKNNKIFSIGVPKGISSVNCISDSTIYCEIDRGLFKLDTENAQWLKLNYKGKIISNSKGDFFIYGDNGIFKSTNDGETWNKILNDWAISFVIDSNDIIYISTSSYYLYRSTDNGLNWEILNTPYNFYVRSIAANDSVILISNEYLEGPLIYRSFNSGMSWEPSNFNINPVRSNIFTNSLNELFFEVDNSIFKSSDNGLNWTLINGQVPQSYCFAKDKNDNIYIGTEKGVFKVSSNDNTIFEFGLNGLPVYDITTYKNYLLAGTGNGLYSKLLADTSGASDPPDTINVNTPNGFTLFQNFPNPFNSITTIKFYIEKSDFVTLKLFNDLGEELKTLVSQELEGSYHTIIFESKNLPSGVYYYRLKAGRFSETRKMILLK